MAFPLAREVTAIARPQGWNIIEIFKLPQTFARTLDPATDKALELA
jgi:hypothetical protein